MHTDEPTSSIHWSRFSRYDELSHVHVQWCESNCHQVKPIYSLTTCIGLAPLILYFSYQLTPTVHYPTPIEEGVRVARYVIDHYEEFSIDPAQVFLFGDSAGKSYALLVIRLEIVVGGNMAVVVERHLRRPDTPPVRGVLLLYPLLQLVNFRLASYRTYLPYRLLSLLRKDTLAQVANFYVNSSFSEDELFNNQHLSLLDHEEFYSKLRLNVSKEDMDDTHLHLVLPEKSHPDTRKLFDENVSPLLASDEILLHSPATFIVACTYDVLLSDAQLYYRRLQRLNVKNVIYREFRIFHGVMTFVDFPVAFAEAFDIIHDSAQFVVNRTTVVK